ncbi:anaerobic sulfatase maturase [Methanocella sp. CWC-04]|uniref:Anaerobic sulfatase maturase n=1 Tax=Methanooceanicella nereidis TaxID=2052831 RepID=A0AAP2RBH3_9EURY|nr:anaerobic sulfatase maturase [Methanocella sp. CWC-04]MCD1294144.1 anaerobic sulfatase maturase [Methanocella sp. CWC-04]
MTGTPAAFHVLAKPTGSICNLQCRYCFFLSKERLYPGNRFRMDDALLETYIRQVIESHQVPQVYVAWQGGEPTLMGLDFYRKSIELEKKHKKPDMTIINTLQTNGTTLDDEWCRFFKENNFLIGISIDGPRELHDAYRVDRSGNPTFDRVMRGLRLLQKYDVDFNILATIHASNADHPLDVYRFFRDEAGAQFIQFIPIVERDNETGFQEGQDVTGRSVKAEQFGNFLKAIFDEWVRRDVGRVFVQTFDVALANWAGVPSGLCIFSPTCGEAMALEHNGDMYSCDHFVEPKYFLGNIKEMHMSEIAGSLKQSRFGRDKLETLPAYCRECEVRFACHGGCPKDRIINTPDGEPGLNYLCAGYRSFFDHIDRPMKMMAQLLRQNRAPAEIMQILAGEQARRSYVKIGRNDPCPCGSGLKFKRCHGKY